MLITACLGLSWTPVIQAAQNHTETFDSDLSGWTHQGQGSTSWVGGAARASFGAQGLPTPETASMLGGSNASSGAFAGDFGDAGLDVIGFDFLAEQALPSLLKLEWISGTNIYFRDLKSHISVTGVWHTLTVSLASRAAGMWQGPEDEFVFVQSLQSVTQLALRVSRTGGAAQGYRIDNITVGARPHSSSAQSASPESISLEWTNLRTNRAYTLQGAIALDGSWTHVSSWTAGVSVVEIVVPYSSTNRMGFYRLVQEEVHAP